MGVQKVNSCTANQFSFMGYRRSIYLLLNALQVLLSSIEYSDFLRELFTFSKYLLCNIYLIMLCMNVFFFVVQRSFHK